MRDWTDAETRELISLWPVASAAQIARRLHRSRHAVSGKADRLIRDGVLPAETHKHFETNPWPPRARPKPTTRPAKPPPSIDATAPLQMRPCPLAELDDTRCHWPLGDVYQVATLFCGGEAAPHRRYCAHHLRRASSRHA